MNTPQAPTRAQEPSPLRMVSPAEMNNSTGSPAIVAANGVILISLRPRTPNEAITTNKDLQEAGFIA